MCANDVHHVWVCGCSYIQDVCERVNVWAWVYVYVCVCVGGGGGGGGGGNVCIYT